MFHLDVPPNYAHFKPLPSAHELLKTHITKSSCRKEWVFLEIRVRVYVLYTTQTAFIHSLCRPQIQFLFTPAGTLNLHNGKCGKNNFNNWIMIQNYGRIEFYESLIPVFVRTCRLIDTDSQRHLSTAWLHSSIHNRIRFINSYKFYT